GRLQPDAHHPRQRLPRRRPLRGRGVAAESVGASMSHPVSRRDVLVQGTIYGSALWLFMTLPRPRAAAAAQASTARATLSEARWTAAQALTARTTPTDDARGAVEAGCVNFIDKALAHEDAKLLPLYAAGLAGVDAAAKARAGKPFVGLAPDDQDEVLAALESGT